jgi:hypothetical protein
MKEKRYTIDIETNDWIDAIMKSKSTIEFSDIRPKGKAVVTKTPKEPETNRMLLIC